MKKGLLFIFLMVVTIFICGCGSENSFDTGYEAGWNGEEEPSFFVSKQKREGYEQGLADAYSYDMGYQDRIDHKEPKFTDDYDYMDGYKNASKEK